MQPKLQIHTSTKPLPALKIKSGVVAGRILLRK